VTAGDVGELADGLDERAGPGRALFMGRAVGQAQRERILVGRVDDFTMEQRRGAGVLPRALTGVERRLMKRGVEAIRAQGHGQVHAQQAVALGRQLLALHDLGVRHEEPEQEVVGVSLGIRKILELDRELLLVVEAPAIHGQALLGQDLAQGVAHGLGADDRVLVTAARDLLQDRAILLALAAIVGAGGRVGEDGGEQVGISGHGWLSLASRISGRISGRYRAIGFRRGRSAPAG
jgi:hypothetical protein